jgi:hypothetical protein
MGRTVDVIDDKVVYDGRTLAEWVPDVVGDLVRECDPIQIILFDSVARGDDGPHMHERPLVPKELWR